MKRILSLLLPGLLAAVTLFAQTPEEILARMDQETQRFDPEGFSMVMEIRVPLLGAIATTIYTRGDKYKMITGKDGDIEIDWSDGQTDWKYESKKNEVTIETKAPGATSDAENNTKMLDSVTEGYDVRLRKETADTWQFRCTKSKTNPNKDDPKTMDLEISKATYLPVCLKASAGGVTVSLRDFSVGVSEQEVTFDASQYASAHIIDKR